MPQNVYCGTHGTLLRMTRTGDNSFDRTVLGSFETWSVTANQRLVQHDGPKDSVEYHTPVKYGWTASITRFVPSADATPDDDDGSGADADVGTVMADALAADSTAITFSGKDGAGNTITGSVHWSSIALALSGDADKETIELQGTGALSIS